MSLIGFEGKLYVNKNWYDSDPNYYTTPDWLEITLARDVSLDMTRDTHDVTPYQHQGFRGSLTVLMDANVRFGFLHAPADAAFDDEFAQFRDALLNGNKFEVLVMDQDRTTSGAQGLRTAMMLESFVKMEPLNGAQLWDGNLRQYPYPDQNKPEWSVTP